MSINCRSVGVEPPSLLLSCFLTSTVPVRSYTVVLKGEPLHQALLTECTSVSEASEYM